MVGWMVVQSARSSADTTSKSLSFRDPDRYQAEPIVVVVPGRGRAAVSRGVGDLDPAGARWVAFAIDGHLLALDEEQ
jgi:hypothetical protein